MGKILIFVLLWRLTGSPIIAVIVLLIIFYVLERRYVGLTPSIVKPLRRFRTIRRLRQQVAMNPNDIPAKHELARLLIERKRFAEAKSWLMPMQDALENSAEFWDDLGTALLQLGEREAAQAAIGNALSINPRVKYGTPYLRLATIHAKTDPQKAIGYLQSFRAIHSSSIEAYYRLAGVYAQMGQRDEAKGMLKECGTIYRSLPRYKKRQERKWALLAWLKAMRT
ncbi:tetratricopeptide repeat protein [Paenibacillus sacheonensis]|uniref:Tetratricopeptide repeat protein n=1 Tax=Paenibacillus sacheonensis TaxID=742054 RepID=A0A7X4YSJ3_9BACL|nr:tetratricopeptide repeat protein [Paenibacillus sacheonensis]MBM7569216.1 tetratricopeptide (TPR) repeat protein [Paenibacillus sacheonensis]NBC71772.1 tetratricopeptide repeat protein [Paenibacillus sacheonensis]